MEEGPGQSSDELISKYQKKSIKKMPQIPRSDVSDRKLAIQTLTGTRMKIKRRIVDMVTDINN